MANGQARWPWPGPQLHRLPGCEFLDDTSLTPGGAAFRTFPPLRSPPFPSLPVPSLALSSLLPLQPLCSPLSSLSLPSNPNISAHGLGQHGKGGCTLWAILGCFLQISHALHAILHLPSSEESAWQLIHELYAGMLFQIFFMLQCSQRGCFSPIIGHMEDMEDMSPVNNIRCSIPAARSLPQAQSQGSPCDACFAVPAGVWWRA